MRVVFFLLLLANVLVFVWSAGYLGGQEEGREPQRLQNQLHPEQIIVTVVAAPAAAAPTSSLPAALTVSAAPASAIAPTATAAAPAAKSSPVCRRIEGVAPKDGGMIQQSLQKAGFVVAMLPMDERSYWVNIPALPNKAAADKKAAELKALGVIDFHVMQGEGASFVISLGVSNDEAAAAQLLQGLTKKGVKSARLDTRVKPSAALRLELRGPGELFTRLPQLLSAVPGASPADCL
jgi:hypothetical protein